MSPYGIMDSPYFMGGREYRWTDQPIRGIDTLDLMVAFKRIYKDSTNNELPGGKSLERLLAQSLVVVSNPAQTSIRRTTIRHGRNSLSITLEMWNCWLRLMRHTMWLIHTKLSKPCRLPIQNHLLCYLFSV